MKNSIRISTILLILIYMLAGIFGHDPWKQDETYTFGIIRHFYTTHSWLVPVDAGIPFMEKPPIYYWTAVILCKLLGGVFALHDAARVTSFVYTLIAIAFLWKTSRIVFRNDENYRDMCWTTLLLFLGTIGIVRHSHDMFTDVALLAGASIMLYGITLLSCDDERWKAAGFWLGVGGGIAFLSKGLLVPGIFGVSFVVLLVFIPSLRTLRALKALLLAGIVTFPFWVIWPLLLYRHSHELFMQWFMQNNIGRFLGFSVPLLGAGSKPWIVFYTVPWFAFPVFPLAVAACWRARRKLIAPEYLIPFSVSLVGLLLLQAAASSRALYLLPLVPAMSLLAAREVHALPRNITRYWNHTVRLLFLLLVIGGWLVWAGLSTGHNLLFIDRVLPMDFSPRNSQWLAVTTALAGTAFLLATFRLDAAQAAHTARIWFAGMAAAWIAGTSILLPWINETKSYRTILQQMEACIEDSPYRGAVIDQYNVGESIRPMFEYFCPGHGVVIVDSLEQAHNPLLFTVLPKSTSDFVGWRLLWKGTRVLDAKDEELRLYARE